MNKEMTILNALEESVGEFDCKFSACQQEVMSHEEGGEPFMVVHDRAEQSKVHTDSDKDGYQMCGIIKKNATSGVPNNYAIDFRNKVHVGSNGPTEIDTSIMMLCPNGSEKPCFIYLDKCEVSNSIVLVNSEQAYLFTKSINGNKLLQLSEFHILSYSMNTVFKIESGLFTSFSSSVKNVYSEFIQSDSLGPVKNLFLSLWKSYLKEKSQGFTHIAEEENING